MSATQSTPHLTPRFRTGFTAVMAALGVLLATAVTITILSLGGANHTTVPTPVTASQVAAGSTPQIRYLGPRQLSAGHYPLSGGTAATAAADRTASAWSCLGGAQPCLP